MDTSFLTHTGVEAYQIRRFETTCHVHILDLSHAKIKLVRGFMAVDARAREAGAQLAFNANGWGLQDSGTNLSNEYLVIDGVVIQATAIDFRPCMNISKDGVVEFIDRPNFQTAWNVIGFDRYIARNGIYNTAIANANADPRTVYGKDASGCLIILVCDGRSSTEKGLTFPEIWSVMQEFGAVDCANADGGYSSCAYNSFFGGLMNESYKVEYRRTVMQVLGFASQLGEVIPPAQPPTGDSTMNAKGTAKVVTNIKPMSGGLQIAQLQIGDYVYGVRGATDITGFTHYYRADGTKIELGATCKVFIGTNLTVIVEEEPTSTEPPVVDPPAGISKYTLDIEIDEVTKKVTAVTVDGARFAPDN